jgi:formate dehydrogenase subunit gamma
MDFFRSASNPWGQDVLLGIAWDLLWFALVAGAVFVLGHAVYARIMGPEKTDQAPALPGVPEKIERHTLSARLFHWTMSAAMLVLLVTAFVPVIGIQFAWVTIHWIAGVVLLLTIVYHIVHALGWQDWRSMWVDRKDVAEGKHHFASLFTKSAAPGPKAGKYPIDHKMYHHVITVVATAAIVTGVLMMFRVDTWFWERNPYLFSDSTWGIVYVVHGFSGVALVTLVIAHIYFALRPEKWWITMSMINGQVSREEYAAHHDPERWVVGPPRVDARKAGAALPEGVVQDKRRGDVS